MEVQSRTCPGLDDVRYSSGSGFCGGEQVLTNLDVDFTETDSLGHMLANSFTSCVCSFVFRQFYKGETNMSLLSIIRCSHLPNMMTIILCYICNIFMYFSFILFYFFYCNCCNKSIFHHHHHHKGDINEDISKDINDFLVPGLSEDLGFCT